ncbi:MAG: DMT family transporter [Proteobacteria bacterium]|nr:DMT family transporter [Pseudomonadota bacterium]
MLNSADNRLDTRNAIFFALAAFLLFAVVDIFAKWLGQRYPVPSVLLCVAVVGLCMLVPFILWQKGRCGFIPRRPLRLHVMRAAQTTLNAFLVVTALSYIPLADYYGIVFAAPFIAAIASIFFFGDRVGRHRWSAIALGFLGILVIIAPSYHEFNIGTAAALCVPLTLAANAVLLRKIGKDEYPALFPFYSFIGLLAFNLPVTLMSGMELPAAQHLWVFVPYAAAVVLAIALLGRAFAIAPVTAAVAPLQYSSMLWGCLFGSFFFHEEATWNTWAGAAIIIAAGLYLLHRERLAVRAAVTQNAN